jgi:hypothetical protein
MKKYTIKYFNADVGSLYAESSWQAIDLFASAHSEYVRKYLYAFTAHKKKKIKILKKKSS